MPADPTANLGASRVETPPDSIGHVAPSFKTPKKFNTLALRPQYRISLRLGDIDRLFIYKADSKAGRLARLQVLGLFYWPLDHRVAAGTPPVPAPTQASKLQPLKPVVADVDAKAKLFLTAATAANTAAAKALTAYNAWGVEANVMKKQTKGVTALAKIAAAVPLAEEAVTAATNLQTAATTFESDSATTGVSHWGTYIKGTIADPCVAAAIAARDACAAAEAKPDGPEVNSAATLSGTMKGKASNAKAYGAAAVQEVDRHYLAAQHVDARQNPNGSAYTVAWNHFKKNFCTAAPGPAVSDADADKQIQKRLREWVIQKYTAPGDGCAYTTGAESKGGGELPISPDEGEKPDEAKGHFAKLRLPGGYPLLSPFVSSYFCSNLDERAGIPKMGLLDDPYVAETAVFAANAGLGKIPIIAMVEVWKAAEGKWGPAPKDVEVGFRLIKPFALPAFDAARGLNLQLNRASLRDSAWSITDPPVTRDSGTGPRHFTKIREEHDWNDGNKNDPQRENAHVSFGGKRADPGGVDDVIFALGDVPGITQGYVPPSVSVGGGPPRVPPKGTFRFPLVVTFGDATVNGVKTTTNDAGEACAVFMPSRCAGDRYRLCAFVIDPAMDDQAKKGEGLMAVKVETGTLVTWRNIRFSRLATLKLPTPDLLNVGMVAAAKISPDIVPVPTGATDPQRWMWSYLAVKRRTTAGRGLATMEMQKALSGGKVGDPFDGLHSHFARAFCELDFDPSWNTPLSAAEWNLGVKTAIEDAYEISIPRANITWSLNDLLFRNLAGNATDTIDEETGFLFPARTPAQFDAKAGGVVFVATVPEEEEGCKSNRKKAGSLFGGTLLPGFMRTVAHDGYLPGITIVHALMGCNLYSEHADFDLGYSGMAMHYNGAFNFFGIEGWPETIGDPVNQSFGYGYMSNVLHEIGHVLYKQHAAGLSGSGKPAGGPMPEYHDEAGYIADAEVNEPPHGTCIMSYRASEGQLCAKCNFGLRGWNIKGSGPMKAQMPAPPPEAPPDPDPDIVPPPPKKKGIFGRLFGF